LHSRSIPRPPPIETFPEQRRRSTAAVEHAGADVLDELRAIMARLQKLEQRLLAQPR
jgi:hypothetical protein